MKRCHREVELKGKQWELQHQRRPRQQRLEGTEHRLQSAYMFDKYLCRPWETRGNCHHQLQLNGGTGGHTQPSTRKKGPNRKTVEQHKHTELPI